MWGCKTQSLKTGECLPVLMSLDQYVCEKMFDEF